VLEVLALLALGVPLPACVVGRVPLENAQGSLNLSHDTTALLGDRVALREQDLTVFLQVFQLLPDLIHLGKRDLRLNVVLVDFLQPLPFGYGHCPGSAGCSSRNWVAPGAIATQ
jgi:hypothetical protein